MAPDPDQQKIMAETARACGGQPAYERAKAARKTKLTYAQWVTVRTPDFKRRFGDWEGLRAQQRLDAMEQVRIGVPQAWRGLAHEQLRQCMAETLDGMVRMQIRIPHAELGEIRVGRVGAKKSESSAHDPAKSLIVADLCAMFCLFPFLREHKLQPCPSRASMVTQPCWRA